MLRRNVANQYSNRIYCKVCNFIQSDSGKIIVMSIFLFTAMSSGKNDGDMKPVERTWVGDASCVVDTPQPGQCW
jgi:hypothetical protein